MTARLTSEFREALLACDFALVVFMRESATWSILLATPAAAQLLGVELSELIGRDPGEFISPRDGFDAAMAALVELAAVDGVRAQRRVVRPGGERIAVTSWARLVEVDGRRGVAAVLAPVGDLGRLGRDPAVPWRNLAAIAVGTAGADWVIGRVSADIANVLGGTASDWPGRSLTGLVHPDDAEPFLATTASGQGLRAVHRIRFRHNDGSWVRVCTLVAPDPGDPTRQGRVFSLIGPSAPFSTRNEDRVIELESHLRRIGLEVRAAGVLDSLESLPAAGEFPQLAELSTRQWEILSRLRRGDRVATIAAELYVSPSTVRNHLAAIFRKFGVHSQAELLQLLRAPSLDHM